MCLDSEAILNIHTYLSYPLLLSSLPPPSFSSFYFPFICLLLPLSSLSLYYSAMHDLPDHPRCTTSGHDCYWWVSVGGGVGEGGGRGVITTVVCGLGTDSNDQAPEPQTIVKHLTWQWANWLVLNFVTMKQSWFCDNRLEFWLVVLFQNITFNVQYSS